MTNEDLTKLLLINCGDDEMRPNLRTPYRLKDWYFATSGVTMVQVPVSLCSFTPFPENEKAPDCLRVIPAERHDPITWNIRKLIALVETAPKVPFQIHCETCGGEGEMECDLGHMHECEDCYGDGYTEHTEKLVPNRDQGFEINGVVFRVEILQIIIQSALLIECENISMVWSRPERPCLFEMRDGIQMLVSPAVAIKKDKHTPDYIVVTESLEGLAVSKTETKN